MKKQLTANRGDIVVALIGDEATVKYYFPERDHVRFQPANKTMAPIYVRADAISNRRCSLASSSGSSVGSSRSLKKEDWIAKTPSWDGPKTLAFFTWRRGVLAISPSARAFSTPCWCTAVSVRANGVVKVVVVAQNGG